MTAWVVWLIVIGFDGHNQYTPIQELMYATQAECESMLVKLAPEVARLAEESKATVKELRLSCEAKSVK